MCSNAGTLRRQSSGVDIPSKYDIVFLLACKCIFELFSLFSSSVHILISPFACNDYRGIECSSNSTTLRRNSSASANMNNLTSYGATSNPGSLYLKWITAKN